MSHLPPLGDTIAAIATAAGAGAVGIIRLSGSESYAIASQLFQPKYAHDIRHLPAGKVIYGQVHEDGALIDEGLLLSFRAPHSYTAEDVIELQLHGGTAILRKVLALCLEHGARLALAGEFTLRAYLNGRIDLIQAEAVLALVNAQTDTARRSAALGLSAALTEKLSHMQETIIRVYGNLQAVFDYPEEGVPETDFQQPLQEVLAEIEALLKTARAGTFAQKGARLALIGRPNAGKSSLLNALLGYQRSIVSEQAGTTRDYLEAPLNIAGIPLTLIDTAGIRHTDDAIEASGVSLAKNLAANADLTLFLIDASQPLHEDDRVLMGQLELERSLIIFNKTDLCTLHPQPTVLETAALDSSHDTLSISALTGEGLAALRQAIEQKLLGDVGQQSLWLNNERHAEALRQVRDFVENAIHAPDDLAALDLQEALQKLAEITGKGDISEDALAHIFANFCVGK